MLNLNGSQVKIFTALSSVTRTSGSTNASNFAGFEKGTIIVSTGSGDGGLTLYVQRSGTSSGTFATVASVAQILAGALASGKTYVRSFTIDSSAIWHKLVYDKQAAGDTDAKVIFVLSAARLRPVDQHNDTTVYSDVLGA